jgi:hypothetical protein
MTLLMRVLFVPLNVVVFMTMPVWGGFFLWVVWADQLRRPANKGALAEVLTGKRFVMAV